MIKVLNLYAGLGGNRKLWKNVLVTAIENDEKTALEYRNTFMGDVVFIEDAHRYLLKHYKEYDFIWSSPPCQSHSGTNNFLNAQGVVRYPDMRLYQEILFLQHFCKAKWVVENVKPYYEPLVKPQYCGRHAFWANFPITDLKIKNDIGTMNRAACTLAQKKAKTKQAERNMVNPKIGLHVFNCAFRVEQKTLEEG